MKTVLLQLLLIDVKYYGPGIDPSPFWDENGTAWVSSTFNSSGVVHAPVNLTTGEVTLPFKWLWKGTGGAAPEAAHVYKKDDWYYALLAEGGTREKHMVTMARSRSLHGPYEGAPNNPLLTAYNNTESYFQAVGPLPGRDWSVVGYGFGCQSRRQLCG